MSALPTPNPMASFKVIDKWLRDRGWEDTGNGWKSVANGLVTIATHETAARIQRRRDQRTSRSPHGTTPPAGKRPRMSKG